MSRLFRVAVLLIVKRQRLEDIRGVYAYQSIDKIFIITIDNIISNDSAIDYLKTVNVEKINYFTNHNYTHVKYTTHILNLIVQQNLKEVDESFAKMQNLISM